MWMNPVLRVTIASLIDSGGARMLSNIQEVNILKMDTRGGWEESATMLLPARAIISWGRLFKDFLLLLIQSSQTLLRLQFTLLSLWPRFSFSITWFPVSAITYCYRHEQQDDEDDSFSAHIPMDEKKVTAAACNNFLVKKGRRTRLFCSNLCGSWARNVVPIWVWSAHQARGLCQRERVSKNAKAVNIDSHYSLPPPSTNAQHSSPATKLVAIICLAHDSILKLFSSL